MKKQRIDVAELRRRAEARTDIAPSDRVFDGRRGETRRCSSCAGAGLVHEQLCVDCAGYGVVLVARSIAERARVRRWREVKAEEIKRLGISEEEFEEAEYELERKNDAERESEWARDMREPYEAAETVELRFGPNDELILPRARRRKRRPT